MRVRTWLPAFLALSIPAFADDGARAQDGLTPTDVLPVGRFTIDARLATSLGQGTLDAGPVSIDGDIREFLAIFEAGVGLGMGFEVEAQLPVAFTSEFSFEEGDAELTQESKGLGDLLLGLNFAVVAEKEDDPQLIIGGFIVLPTGDDDPGEAEVVFGGVTLQDGEVAGIGDGAFGFGGQVGLSKRFGQVEPYFLFRYFVAGESDVDDVETDHADVATILLGLEIHAGDQFTIDLRARIDAIGEETQEDDGGGESTEEAYLSYGLQGRVYISLGSQVAIVGGVSIAALEDHAIDEESEFELTDTWIFGAEFGIRVVFGK